jgi:hypothetical protein
MTLRLASYRHPTAGFRLPLPRDWERAEDTEGIALIAVEAERPPWFRANLVVTIERLEAGMDLSSWTDAGWGLLEQTLEHPLLVDLEQTELGGRPARRALVHHTTETGAVTMEQWSLTEAALGYTLTASVGTLEYDDLADLFATVAAGFRPDPSFTS